MRNITGQKPVWRDLLPNRPIFISLLNALRGMVGGAAISLLIASYFTRETQGYHYTFISLLGLQVFVEMGLGTVVLQFASHEWAGLRWEQGRIAGEGHNQARLASLAQLALRWYSLAAAISFLVLTICGYIFFAQKPDAGISWIAPWVCLCAFTAARFCLTPCLSLLEGCGWQNDVYGYRLVEGLCAAAASIGAIMLGAGLWTTVMAAAVTQLCCFIFVFGRHRRFFQEMTTGTSPGAVISWKHDLLPMQWRIALSWMAGYFIFQLITPLLFHYQGAVVAGQVGLTLALANSINSLAVTWLFTRVPTFGRLIALRQWAELDALALRAAVSATCVALLGAVAALSLLYGLQYLQVGIASRFLSPAASLGFLLAVVFQQVIQAEAYYLRSFKREPLLVSSIVCALVTGLSTWYLSAYSNPLALGWGYCAAIALVGLPLSTFIFIRRRREWHQETGVMPLPVVIHAKPNSP